MAFTIRPDPDAIALASASKGLSPSEAQEAVGKVRGLNPGLVLVAEWGWAVPGHYADADGDAAAEGYEAARSSTANVSGTCLYTYPSHATHITVATLSSFKKEDAPRSGLPPKVDATFTEAWAAALRNILADQPVPEFELEAYRLELSAGAAFIHFKDPSGSMNTLRELVAKARDEDPELARLADGEKGFGVLGGGSGDGGAVPGLRSSVHLPDIVHSSYARFISTPDDGVGGDAALQRRFEEEAAATFKPFKVQIRSLTLANEAAPYMHQTCEEGTVASYSLSSAAGVQSADSSGEEAPLYGRMMLAIHGAHNRGNWVGNIKLPMLLTDTQLYAGAIAQFYWLTAALEAKLDEHADDPLVQRILALDLRNTGRYEADLKELFGADTWLRKATDARTGETESYIKVLNKSSPVELVAASFILYGALVIGGGKATQRKVRKVFSSCEHTLFDVADDMKTKRQEFKATYTKIGVDYPEHADALVTLARQFMSRNNRVVLSVRFLPHWWWRTAVAAGAVAFAAVAVAAMSAKRRGARLTRGG